jgi:sialidase-1
LPGEGKTRWLYSHPAGPKGRRDLSVRYSDDEGQTWSAARLLRAGDGQYSCLAQLGADRIGCLYDAWVEGNYRVYFVRFHAAWLK